MIPSFTTPATVATALLYSLPTVMAGVRTTGACMLVPVDADTVADGFIDAENSDTSAR